MISFRSFHLALVAGFLVLPAIAEEKLSFNRDIRPILSDKCFSCHGPDKNTREADLRLDVREAALEMEAIVPGDVKASESYWRILSDDEEELMPPPESHKSLSEEEKKLITRWIEEGAEYEAHWAYLPVTRPEIPEGVENAVDGFVAKRLQKEGLKISSPAEEVTLLRRLHFDITGLPPAPEDLNRFQRMGKSAYVDELLASPHFGERMAIDWLDAVRYADTVGYHGDQTLEVSAFRDWVINSFNENKPFDQFTIEQIAGDLLPDATLEQKVAAAYNRLGQSSNEGGIQDAEYLAKYQAERVRTTATAWLGATLACAECHDHKFDPYTAADFYGFAAYFADILEKGAYTGDGSYQEGTKPYEREGVVFTGRGPQLEVPSDEERQMRDSLRTKLNAAKKELQKTTPELEASAQKWAAKRAKNLGSSDPVDYVYLEDKGEKNEIKTAGVKFVTDGDGKVYQGGFARSQSSGELVQHIVDGSKKPLVVSEGSVLFSYVWLDEKNPPRQIMLQFHHEKAGWNHRAWWGTEALISYGRSTSDHRHRKLGSLPGTGKWVRLEVPISELNLKSGDKITQLAFTQFGGLAYWDTAGIHTSAAAYRLADLPQPIQKILTKAEGARTDEDRSLLLAHYREIAPELRSVRTEVAQLESELENLKKQIRTVPATIAAKPREIRILPRGNWMDKSGQVVEPGTPHFLPEVKEKSGAGTRLELAHWIASPENPLTARTYVNRFWASLFGNGISTVVDDLGSQGQWPTHPELLDWLAAEFVESGWDVKRLVKTIVLSDTYAQSSDSTPALQEKDPYNSLLARQSGIRLPAELVRDNALTVSGLLNPAVGGRSVKPYQPEGYYQHLNFPRRKYQADQNENQYRRGLYTHWQRTFLHPAMKAFDAPSREECTMEREHSSTPLQALVLLNDPSFVEAAKSLAAESEDVVDMFVRVLTRRPSEEELTVLTALFESEKARLKGAAGAANQLLSVGLKEVKTADSIELGARTSVARAILNLHETITRY
ncbi:MAG: PSD1 and planctomycete cytochrome C domain-containing protein [Verrucomicrobiales bacterium]|nr:PSD1 and planctomycete cytochrome C domain-containing protein [Verrucomicrobiales bacterium]